MQHDSLELAYLAGVVDSDGYVTINRSCRAGKLYHAAVVGISGTRREPHDLAASLFGGRVGCFVPRIGKPQFQWSRQGASAVVVIEALRPFLRVKAANAMLALELQQHVEDGRSPDPFPWFCADYDPIAAREAMRSEMVEILNVRRKVPA